MLWRFMCTDAAEREVRLVKVQARECGMEGGGEEEGTDGGEATEVAYGACGTDGAGGTENP